MSKLVLTNPWAPNNWGVFPDHNDASLPKVTIGILNYNRKNDLRRTLDCIILAVSYPDLEIIVVDNASCDGSQQMLSEEFPGINMILLKKNIGAAGRNYFYTNAKGKYVFSFDDDSFPATPSAVYEVVQFLEQNPRVDSLTMYYYQPISGYSETGNEPGILFSDINAGKYGGLFFAEGGMCFKTSSFLRTEGYDPEYLVYGEGLDLTLQMYKLNMVFVYHAGIATLHMRSKTNRQTSFRIIQQTRNNIWTLSKHFPLYAFIPLLFLFICRQVTSFFFYPLRMPSYMKGIIQGIRGIPHQRRKCKKFTLKQMIDLKKWYLLFYRW